MQRLLCRTVVFENVSKPDILPADTGSIQGKYGAPVPLLLRRMLNAADFGVPQIRQRLMFVGVRTGEGFTTSLYLRLDGWRYRTVADAISDLPERLQPGLRSIYQVGNNFNAVQGNTAIKALAKNYIIMFICRRLPANCTHSRASLCIPNLSSVSAWSNEAPSPTQLCRRNQPQFQFILFPAPRLKHSRKWIRAFLNSYVC